LLSLEEIQQKSASITNQISSETYTLSWEKWKCNWNHHIMQKVTTSKGTMFNKMYLVGTVF